MAWTAPRTWVTSETVTAAIMNTHVRDNFLETLPAKATTKGDIGVATAANTITRVAVGGNGTILVADSAATPGVRWSSTSKTASAGSAVGIAPAPSLAAAANSDQLYAMYLQATFAKSTFTGLTAIGLIVVAPTQSGSGTIANAFGIYLQTPTIGTTNWSLYIESGNSRLGDSGSVVFIGDDSNANMTAGGLTINQGLTTGEILALKSGDVAHGVTNETETDTYASLRKFNNILGGLNLRGFSEDATGLGLGGVIVNNTTAKSTSAAGAVHVAGFLASGASVTALGADANILVVRSNTTSRFILDADGDSHQDVGTAWTNYDDYADADLLTALSVHVSRDDDPIREQFGQFLTYNRDVLQAARLVTFNDDGHHFVNMSKLAMLLTGAVRQVAAQLRDSRARIATLEGKLLATGA